MNTMNDFKDLLKDGRILCNLKNLFLDERNKDNLNMVLACLKDSNVIVPMTRSETDVSSATAQMSPDILKSSENLYYMPVFTMESQIPEDYHRRFTMVEISAEEVIRTAMKGKELEGIIIDPFSRPMDLPMELAKIVLEIPSTFKKAEDIYQ